MMNTVTDFWQMIWNTNAGIIVSLYADEKSQVGASFVLEAFENRRFSISLQSDVPDFWPLANQIMDCGNFSVCLIDERFECEYIYRDFLLQSTEVCRTSLSQFSIDFSFLFV